jgi:hypothetical protein
MGTLIFLQSSFTRHEQSVHGIPSGLLVLLGLLGEVGVPPKVLGGAGLFNIVGYL